MHPLTCDLLSIDSYGYAMIPTYYHPEQFIKCKIYVENVYNFESSIYYHVVISELLDDAFNNLKILSTASVRCIHRLSGKISVQPIACVKTLSNDALIREIQGWHKDFVIDLPAPFACKTLQQLNVIENRINDFFKSMYDNRIRLKINV